MLCPSCGFIESKVIDSRPSDDNASIRRRRECLKCGHRFTTYERLIDSPLLVIKADGSSEAYDRTKLMRGLLIACAKRPITPAQIEDVVNGIENELRALPLNEISSKELGERVLQHLSHLDDVAYIRFASVYHDFQSVEEFARVLEELKHE